jgi:hypothetical protein
MRDFKSVIFFVYAVKTVELWKDFSLLFLTVNKSLFFKQFIPYTTVNAAFLPPGNP